MAKARTSTARANSDASSRGRVSQSDVPYYPLGQAIRIPQALADNFGLRPARPIQIAQALNVQPTTGPFRMLCGCAIAYGLTEGGYNAVQISLTPLGKRVVAPTIDGDDARAMREAFLRPRVPREFLTRYDGAKLPRQDIAINVLAEIGVPRDATHRALKLILDGAKMLGFVREINNSVYIDLQQTPSNESQVVPDEETASIPVDVPESPEGVEADPTASLHLRKLATARVFISHGKNAGVVEQVKTMLNVAEIEYEVAVEEQATAIPVPEKILNAMRNCNAAIICVTADDGTGDGSTVSSSINQNVLIEIGAAFVLYDRRVILLWDKRLTVPSNLQGLYRCEFQGNELSWSAGMKLMEAAKKFRI